MVLKEKKYIFIIAGIIVLISTILVLSFFKQENPFHLIKKTIGIKLPSSAKVEKYTYYDEGGYYKVKILLQEKQISDLTNKFNTIFHNSTPRQDYGKMPNFNGTCSWWDMEEEDIVVAYNAFVSSEKKWFKLSPETHGVWAFITKQDDGKYYLYISY